MEKNNKGVIVFLIGVIILLIVLCILQAKGIGFIIGVIQDSTETALNSSSDVVFTAAANKITSVPKD